MRDPILEDKISTKIINFVDGAFREAQSDDRDLEDGLWPEKVGQLEAIVMQIVDEVKSA